MNTMTDDTTSWRIDPDSLRLIPPSGSPNSYTADEFAQQQWPPCPVCGTTVDVDWIEVTLNERDERLHGRTYMPGRWDCPRSCDPITGQRRHLSREHGQGADGYYLRCSCGADERSLSGAELRDLLAQHEIG